MFGCGGPGRVGSRLLLAPRAGAEDAARSVVAEASVAKNWVKEEAEDGLRRGVLFPVFFEKVLPPRGFQRRLAADLVDWEGDAADPSRPGRLPEENPIQ